MKLPNLCEKQCEAERDDVKRKFAEFRASIINMCVATEDHEATQLKKIKPEPIHIIGPLNGMPVQQMPPPAAPKFTVGQAWKCAKCGTSNSDYQLTCQRCGHWRFKDDPPFRGQQAPSSRK
jgi:hypothetical protein